MNYWQRAMLLSSAALLPIVTLFSGPAIAQDCYSPIEIPQTFYADSVDKVKRLALNFTPVDDTVCLPTSTGPCAPLNIRRVSIDIQTDAYGRQITDQYNSAVKAQEPQICQKIPSWLYGDCNFSRITSDMLNADIVRGNFTLHLEKWASMTGTCCHDIIFCHACEWKTKLWERSLDGQTDISRGYTNSNRKLQLVPSTTLDHNLTGLEYLFGSVVGSALGIGELTGAISIDVLIKSEIDMFQKNIPDDRVDVPSPTIPIGDAIADQTIKAIVTKYFDPDSIRYKLPKTMFSRETDGSFILRMIRGRDETNPADRKSMPSEAEFCDLVRPVLLSEFSGGPVFAPTPPTELSDIGTQSREVVVKNGDTLWSIANKAYKIPYLFSEIKLNNPDMGNTLHVGQVVKLLSFREIVGSGYLISRGESLWSIAKRMGEGGTQFSAIPPLNQGVIFNPNRIFAMQKNSITA